MKNGCLFILLLLFGSKSFGQGTDVIFLVDNSNSIGMDDPNEYSDMYQTLQDIMYEVLACNPENRYTIVQYSAEFDTNVPRIYIETPFTNIPITFARRYQEAGRIFDSLDLVDDALKGIVNTVNVTSPLKTLNNNGNSLVLFILTDCERSDFVAPPYTLNSSAVFKSYTDFKNEWNGKVVVALKPPGGNYNQLAIDSAAGVASKGGNYVGTIETYFSDPDGSGALPRLLELVSSLNLTPFQVQTIAQQLCTVGEPSCPVNLTLISPTNDVGYAVSDYRQASNSITASNIVNNGASGQYHAGNVVYLKPGFQAKVGSNFRAYIEGCSGDFAARGFIDEDANAEDIEIKSFMMSPNPANEKVMIEYDGIISNLMVTSIEGVTMFNQTIGKNSYDLYVANYKRGIYVVTIQTQDGKVLTEKLMKN